jgi:hypothetical protein
MFTWKAILDKDDIPEELEKISVKLELLDLPYQISLRKEIS